jgi:hypothetical protein
LRSKRTSLVGLAAILAALVPFPSAVAAPNSGQASSNNNGRGQTPLIARELAPEHRHEVPRQATPAEVDAAVAASTAELPDCGITDPETWVLTLQGFDPENPLEQDVVFYDMTPADSTGNATLWVAWDFLTTDYGREDVITCDMLAYLQSKMDEIVATDVEYFGDYLPRGGSDNIEVMIYNIVDESYFDEDFGSYIAGFFSSGFQEEFDRNMIFIDSYDWPNRIGSNDSSWRPDDGSGNDRPFLYEGTVAHELEHLIHNDHDGDEESWIDEGLADLAQLVNGFGHDDGHVVYYLAFHRTSLTQWGSLLEDYGAAYLFQVYLAEQFAGLTEEYHDYGADADLKAWTRALVEEDANSIEGVELTATAFNGGDAVSFVDLFDSWILANYLDEPDRLGAGDWPLGYVSIDLRPFVTESFSPWSIERSIKDVYGAGHHGALPVSRYYGGYQSGTVEYPVGALAPHTPLYSTFKAVQPELDVWLRGDGASGVAPYDGEYELASGSGHMLEDRWVVLGTPTASVDFWTWFNIEEDWDFAFVEVADGAGGWVQLEGSITRYSDDPFGSTAWANSLGDASETNAAITGSSDGWVEAHFDIPAAYAGNTVRLNYYTDEAYNDEGMFVDLLSIDGGTPNSFEDGDPAFEPNTWTRTTGLFTNDWVGAYVNPVYERGKLAETQVGYLTSDVYDADGREYTMGMLDTNSLNRDEAMIVFANRPGESPFDANYLFLPEKGDAN